jgi:hypothetical protein
VQEIFNLSELLPSPSVTVFERTINTLSLPDILPQNQWFISYVINYFRYEYDIIDYVIAFIGTETVSSTAYK